MVGMKSLINSRHEYWLVWTGSKREWRTAVNFTLGWGGSASLASILLNRTEMIARTRAGQQPRAVRRECAREIAAFAQCAGQRVSARRRDQIICVGRGRTTRARREWKTQI